MNELMSSGFDDFDRLALLYRRTRELLDAVSATGDLPSGASDVLATETLPHVEDMEHGFQIWLRASQAEKDELRTLITRAGLVTRDPRDPAEQRAALVEAVQMLSGAGGEREIVAPSTRRLAALELARLTFAMLPTTPASDVHYPAGRRSYADIFPPRSPVELAERIEELERTLWRLAVGRPPSLSDGPYRRTYGFFDTAARMSSRGFLLS
jgi:hypothetical protein